MKKFLSFLARLWKKEPSVGMSGEVFPQLTSNRDVVVMNKENLPKIKAGMFWFTDNTFSKEFISGMNVRAVVLSVYENCIIGWLPNESSLTCFAGQTYSEYQSKLLYNGDNVKLIERMPMMDDLLETFANYRILCESCSSSYAPEFMGFYWSWEKGKPSFRYAPKTGERSIPFKDSGAKVRWILEAQLK